MYRGTIRTYSRQLKRVRDDDGDVEVPIKRIRMDGTGKIVEETVGATDNKDPTSARGEGENAISSSTAPSSPQRHEAALFSSDPPQGGDSASPPSSPPPARLPSPVAKSRKPAFAFLKRKRPSSSVADTTPSDGHEPLMEITDNVGTAMEKPVSKKRKKRLTQMQIDLGGEVRKACKTCGMDYIPSNAEDAGLHKKFHAMNVGGVWIRKAYLTEMKKRKIVDVGGARRLYGSRAVVVVDGRSSPSMRFEAKRVLEVVNTELSAAEMEDQQLWGQTSVSSASKQGSAQRLGLDNPVLTEGGGRFKVYLYLDRNTCVGLCLAEKIEHAYKVVDPCAGDDSPEKVSPLSRSSSISTSATADAALLGISRIWTSTSHRRKGIAAVLLDAARRNFFYGMEIPKAKVAFSQPTESGGQLAEHWFEARAGWHVYAEER